MNISHFFTFRLVPFAAISAALSLTLDVSRPAQAQGASITTLHTFDKTYGDGPDGALLQATDGALYGVTGNGGIIDGQATNFGTIFKLTLP